MKEIIYLNRPVLEEINLNLFLGFETSSTAMIFCLYELAQNMDIQEKLREEIVETLKENDGNLTYELMIGMKYLHKVVDGTMNLIEID